MRLLHFLMKGRDMKSNELTKKDKMQLVALIALLAVMICFMGGPW